MTMVVNPYVMGSAGGGGGAVLTPQRYWSFVLLTNYHASGTGVLNFSEFKVYSGGVDITSAINASGVDTALDSGTTANWFDGNDATDAFWNSVNKRFWIDFGAGDEQIVDEIRFTAVNNGSFTFQTPKTGGVYYSNISSGSGDATKYWDFAGTGSAPSASAVVTYTPGALSLSRANIRRPYGEASSAAVTVAGGFQPRTYAIVTGSLPTGVTLDADTGELTIADTTALGTTSGLVMRVTDFEGDTADTASFAIEIANGWRYVGIKVTATGNNYVSCATMEHLVDGVNIITGGTPGMDNNNASFLPANAFDGNISTFALADPSPPTVLWYDYGSGVSVLPDQIAWTSRNDVFGPNEQPTALKTVGKNASGDAWTEVSDPGAQGAWGQGERRVFTF